MGLVTDDLDKFDFLALDLAVDHVITAWQARRWYRLSQADLLRRGFILEKRGVKPTKGARSLRTVTFVMVDERFLEHSDVSLLHLAGTAEMRYAMGVGVVFGGEQEWSSSAWREAATLVPDALWERPDGARVAIEFDSTHYDNERVAEKAARFAAFDRQVWGAPTEVRVEALRERVLAVDPRAEVILANPLGRW